ncbi:MAG: tetratricopeptide repeat protein [candidate division WOR-3 bacterium]|nr:MAG: tetratricopeptide repeat protein [candidate division WOR-3 bacterium]
MLSKRLKSTTVFLIILVARCAYFNTFYNTQNYYRQAKKTVTHDTLRVDSELFEKTIEKATAVIVKFPHCRWVDDALLMMGASYYYKGDYSRALEKLNFLCLNYPESNFYDDACYYRGLVHYKQNRGSAAIISLREAAESGEYRKKAMIALCYVYRKERNYSALTEIAQKLLGESLGRGEKREVLHLLGEAQFDQQLYEGALETYTQALSITRTREEERALKLRIAAIYLEMKRYEECESFLTGESDAEFRTLLADLNAELGNVDKAKEIYLDVAHKSYADFSAQAYYKLAELYESDDSLEAAIAYYDSSISKSATNEYSLSAKKKSNVLKRIKSLTEETENIDRAQFLLAEIYFVDLNEPMQALEEYEKVYQDFPASEWAPKALYAQFWITKHYLQQDSLAWSLAQDLFTKYPNTEYAVSVSKMLEQE